MDKGKVVISVEGDVGTGKNALINIIAEALEAKGLGGIVTRIEDRPGASDPGAVKATAIELVEVPAYIVYKKTPIGQPFPDPQIYPEPGGRWKLVPEVVEATLLFEGSENFKNRVVEDIQIYASDEHRTILHIDELQVANSSGAGPSTRIELVVDHHTGKVEQNLGRDCIVRLSDGWVLELAIKYSQDVREAKVSL